MSANHLSKLTGKDVQAYERGWLDDELDSVYLRLESVLRFIEGLSK